MRIDISEEGTERRFSFPLCLIPSGLVARAIVKKGQWQGGDPGKMKEFLRQLKRFAKENPGWVLVEVDEGDERTVITL